MTRERIFIDKQHPAVYRALNGLGLKVREAADAAGIERMVTELINIRVSQINGCAYCLNMHVTDALANGETIQRIVVLPAWRDTQLFTAQEQGALALAESLTELPDHESQDRAYAFARKCLTEDQLSAVSWITLTMNAYNRLSIISEHPVRAAKA
ncbi:carboxymuconolactone decarboxylase family protein [Arthrobacter sp. SF27]|nr:carboxymuconolactone decarboxylase family protein [Arthrobacter sp. SF27]